MTDNPVPEPKPAAVRPTAWPYRADPPQRYWGTYQRYRQRGGLVDLEDDVRGFVSGGNVGDMARFFFFSLAFDQIMKEGLSGDLAELGVYRGNTASLIARMARRLGRTAFLLDTFEGFSESDFRGIDSHQKMQFTDTSLEGVSRLVGEENVRFIKGHFPGTASELPDTSYCLVHIDCDLYAPILSALEYFYPRLVPGGYLIVHDYSSLAWDGAERAVDEFFSDKPESLIGLPDGAGSVAIRKARDPVRQPGWLARKRLALASGEWVSAGEGRLAENLGDGWSGTESWGVWAVGAESVLRVYLPAELRSHFMLELDVHAPLMDENQEQSVDVLVSGRSVGQLRFTREINRGTRSVSVSQDFASDGMIQVVFRPGRTIRPVDYNPSTGDARQLGFALHKVRVRF